MSNAIFLKTRRFYRTSPTLLIILFLAVTSLSPHIWAAEQSNAVCEASSPETYKLLSIAEAKLDIVKALIAQGKFERVPAEMKVIFQLNLPDKCEGAVKDAAIISAKLLVDQNQFEIAHRVMDDAFLRMKLNANKAAVLMLTAGIYRLEGKLDKAIAAWEQAIKFEKEQVQ